MGLPAPILNAKDIAVWVHGVLHYAKVQYHTHTHGTHFGSTMDKPIPMQYPNPGEFLYPIQADSCPFLISFIISSCLCMMNLQGQPQPPTWAEMILDPL